MIIFNKNKMTILIIILEKVATCDSTTVQTTTSGFAPKISDP